MAVELRRSGKRAQSNEFQNSYAFVIGINDYRNGVPALRSAANDARRLAQLLEEQHDYTTHLFVEEVTREALRQLFTETMRERVGAQDRVLLYFAGHGIALEGEDGPEGYLLPEDAKPEDTATLLAMREVSDWLAALGCRHLLVILDCCFAGTFRWASTRDVIRLPSVIYKEVYERFVREPAWQVLTSTAYDQKALDTVAGQVIGVREQMAEAAQQLHSPFALALFDALTGSADVIPINGGDGIITATELFMFMRDQVVNEVADYHNQTPGLWPLRREYDKGEFIFLDPNGTLQLEPAPPLTFENNPYRGLKSYDAKHKKLFFGRDELISQLAEQIDRSPFTAVLGASGTGKSSLVKAGLMPHLHEMGYYTLDPVRPAANPMQALDGTLRSGLTFEKAVPNSASLRGLLARWQQQNPDKKLLLIIDQFEELITQCRYESERNAFLTKLMQLVAEYADFLRVVVTLRSDFESHFAGSQSELTELWTDEVRFIVPPMNQIELREVIVRPAAERALYFEPSELVDELISAVSQTPGALPLLSFTLSELYIRYIKSQRGDRALHKEDYDALGGVVGALRFRAEEEYGELSADQQKTLQRIMLRMIALEGDGMTRRRVMRQELKYRDEKENERVNTILARLENARLVVADADQDGNRYVEPAHDSLVSSWGLLHQWRMNAAEYLPLQRRVALSAEDWHNEPDPTQKSGLLWHDDSRLPTVAGLLPTDINKDASQWRKVADRGVQVVDRLRVGSADATEERWLNALETDFTWQSVQRRWRNTRRLWGSVLTAFAIVATLALFANSLRITANENEAFAQVESTRAFNQQGTAEAESTKAVEALVTATIAQGEAEINAQEARDQQEESERKGRIALAQSLSALSPILDTVDGDRDIRLLLALEAHHLYKENGGNVPWLTDSAMRTALNLPNIHKEIGGQETDLYAVAFHPDPERNVLAASGQNGTTWIWDLDNPTAEPTLLNEGQWVTALVFHPDPRRNVLVSSGQDGLIYVWDLDRRGSEPLILTGHTDWVRSLTFHPNQERNILASASWDGTVRIWDLDNVEAEPVVLDHENSVGEAAFYPDPERTVLATVGSDKLSIWDIEQSNIVPVDTQTYADELTSVAFHPSPQRDLLVSASTDTTIQIWDFGSLGESPMILGHAGYVNSLAFYPDSERSLLISTHNETVQLWNLDEPTIEPITFEGHTTSINAGAFHPDPNRNLLVTVSGHVQGSDDHPLRFWNLATLQADFTHSTVNMGIRHIVGFHPDPQRDVIAFETNNQLLKIWDLDKPAAEIATLQTAEGSLCRDTWNYGWSATPKHSAIFHPDPQRNLLIYASNDQTVKAISLDNPNLGPSTLFEHAETVCLLVMHPNGKKIVFRDSSNKIQVWDLDNHDSKPIILDGHTYAINSLTFHPDPQRNTFISVSHDDIGLVWDLDNPEAEPVSLGENIGVATSIVFHPNPERTVLAYAEENTVLIWDLDDAELESTVISGITNNITSLAFHPDPERNILVSASGEESVYIWDLDALDAPQTVVEHTFHVSSAIFDPNPKTNRLISVGDNGEMRVWDLDRTPIETVTDSRYVGVARSLRLRITANRAVQLWDLDSLDANPTVLPEHSPYVQTVAFHPDPQRNLLASGVGGYDSVNEKGTVWVWNLNNSSEEPIVLGGHNNPVVSVVFHPAPQRNIVASVSKEVVQVWDLDELKQAPIELTPDINVADFQSAAFHPDPERNVLAVTYYESILIWDLNNMNADPIALDMSNPETLVFHPNPQKNILVAGSGNGSIQIWNLDTPDVEPINLLRHGRSSVSSLAFHPDLNRSLLALGDLDGTIELWNLDEPNAKPIVRAESTHSISSIAFHPDPTRNLLASSDKKAIRIWDFENGETQPAKIVEHTHDIWSIAFHPDPQRDLLASGGNDKTVSLWQTLDGLTQVACESLSRNLTEAEWNLYIGDLVEWREQCNLEYGVPVWWEDDKIASNLVIRSRALAENGNLDQAISLLEEALLLDSEMQIDPTKEARRIYADALLVQGRFSAMSGDVDGATGKFEMAFALNPTVQIDDPHIKAKQLYAEALMTEGRSLAVNGDVGDATEKFELALTLDTAIQIDPSNEARRMRAQALAEESLSLSHQWEIEEAVALIEEAELLYPEVETTSDGEIKRAFSKALSAVGVRQQIWNGDISTAIETFERIRKLDIDSTVLPDFASDWNTLCWVGTLHDFAAEVLFACEAAVTSAPDQGHFYDSRGLAYALTGNVAGAIEDFEFALTQVSDDPEFVDTRTSWIEALRAGEDPATIFDEETLEALSD